jgi:hypothetical protein
MFENYRSSPQISATFFHGINYDKERVWPHFGDFFSQTHPVALLKT